MDSTDQIDQVRDDFITRMGVVAMGEGLPRMAGQVFAMLVFEGEPIAFGALSRRLSVSRATISTSIRLLEERGLIRRVNKTGDRQDYFQLADDAYAAMTKYALAGTRHAKSEINDTIRKLPEEAEGVRQRLDTFAAFYDTISAALDDVAIRVSKPKN
ncbi:MULTISPECIES: GbsR/MarR family transcriptional regulator [Sulfitobacter]|nr:MULTISPECIES: MarR family transcriptional regulator [Sulfitobacter]MDF3402796.1 MarR family transcriptional regulator [Sulfitobacter sp. Ks35]MDF3409874.1 MarR family transcriptional regulator [Sulfitobacter sp. KE38]WCE66935.1 MarR family transcriptional regulator [Sulfitobacter faviae]